jgi:hypothetical protein
VDFGSNTATAITVVSSTEITAFSPPGTGAVHVTVTTLTGSSLPTGADVFTYSADGPQVTLVQRFGVHAQPTFIVIAFNSALDPIPAENQTNFVIVGPGKRHIKVRSASYDPTADTVKLQLAQRLSLRMTYTLRVNGTTPTGVTGASGLLLDGAGTGQPGSDFVTTLTEKNLVTPGTQQPTAAVAAARKSRAVVRL